MVNNRPALWWQSAPKIIDGKFICVAINSEGEETTDGFTLEELVTHLTQRAADECWAVREKHLSASWKFCPYCGASVSTHR
jgi:hypothetical protein